MRLGEILIESDVITPEQLDEALDKQKRFGGKLGTVLIELGYAAEAEVCKALSQQMRVPAVSRAVLATVPRNVLDLVPHSSAAKYRVCPVRLDGSRLYVATATPGDRTLLSRIADETRCEIRAMVAPELIMSQALELHYGVPQRPRVIPVAGHEDAPGAQVAVGPPPAAPRPRVTSEQITLNAAAARMRAIGEQPAMSPAPAPRARITAEFPTVRPGPSTIVTVDSRAPGRAPTTGPSSAVRPPPPIVRPMPATAAPSGDRMQLGDIYSATAMHRSVPAPIVTSMPTPEPTPTPSRSAAGEVTPPPEILGLADLAARFGFASRQTDITEAVLGYLRREFGTVVMVLLRGGDQIAGRRAVGRVTGAEVRAWSAPRATVPILAQPDDSPPRLVRDNGAMLGRLVELLGPPGSAPCLILPMRCGGRPVGFFVAVDGSDGVEARYHEYVTLMTKMDMALQILVLRQHIMEQS